MKKVTINHESASHRFIRNYMAAHEITSLNELKGEINHGLRQRPRCNLNTIPVCLLGDKPRQPETGRLTFQPFSTLALV